MRVAIFSDVHANAGALRLVLADARKKGVTRFVCLGDIVGYGPLPAETIALVRENCAVVLAGNHDAAIAGRFPTDDFSSLAASAVARHREELSSDDLDYLNALPLVAEESGFAVAHGDFTDPGSFRYVQSKDDAKANFAACDAQLMFVGHTHVPALFLTGNSGAVYELSATNFELEEGKRYLVNVGSVGYPRDGEGTCLSSYVIYDTDAKSVTFHYVPFEISTVLQRSGASKPRRHLKWMVAAILAVIFTVCAIVFFVAAPQPSQLSQPSQPSQPSTIRTYSVNLSAGAKELRPNLFLSPQSAPAMLKVAFLDAEDKPLKVERIVVKRRREKPFAIPEGAVCAEITVDNVEGQRSKGEIIITGFTPEVR